MTHNERVLQLLSDGKPHSHHELYQLHVIAHSRVSDLRKRGYEIEQWRDGDLYLYRLNKRLASGAGTEAGGGEKTPAPSLHADKDTAPRSADESSPSPDGSPAGVTPLPAGQLLLLDPYSRNVA